jgi:hypothetical protein
MLQNEEMNSKTTPAWIPDEEAADQSGVVLTTAELAECTCPDPCECDHDN